MTELLSLGRRQAQVVTRRQAQGLGVGRSTQQRLVGLGQWQRLARGVLLLHGGEPDFEARCWAGLLLGGERSMVAGAAAGRLWGLWPEPELVELLVPHELHPADQGSWHFRRTRLLPGHRGEIRRSTVEETVLDLCASHPAQREALVADACQRRTTRARLRRRLAARPRFPGRAEMLELLRDDQDGVESVLEGLYLRRVERAHGLPVGMRQVRGRGQRRDVVYELGLVVELDGRRGHEGSGAFRDMERDNLNTALGLRSLRYGWGDCRQRPCAVAAQVARMLNALGWPGVMTRCPNCP